MVLRKEQLLSRLHYFIFGATIVGETAVTSLVVASFGSEILGKLYFVNGGILLLLPMLFFNKIDRINRGNLLAGILRYATLLIALLFIMYKGSLSFFPDHSTIILLLFYPVSYLLKTVLFLTFWTMTTDVCEPVETKTIFPRVASSGFIGGLSGAVFSWGLLNFLSADYILLFWGILYFVAYIIVNRVVAVYNDRLIPKEILPQSSANHLKSLFSDTKLVFENSLVRHISILHFGVFVSIFLVDFHFWQQCSSNFSTASKLSQFQYGFYVVHSLVTILLLRYVTPDLIALRGFTRIFSYLPLTLLIGSVGYITVLLFFGGNKFTFSLLLIWQLFRYLSFENFFSPIYQMFFAAIEKEKRGRAKTVIEGLVKPLAIITASIIISLIGKNSTVIVLVVVTGSLFLFLEALKIKHAYLQSLVSMSNTRDSDVYDVVSNIGSTVEKECIQIIEELAQFSTQDMKRISIKLLIKMDRPESNAALNNLVINSTDTLLIRETARYAGEIKHNTQLLGFLIQHSDSLVWHKTVLSLVLNKSHLSDFTNLLKKHFWIGEPEDRVFAGIYLCSKEKSPDIPHLKTYLDTLLISDKQCYVELATLGYTVLQLGGWERIAIQFVSICAPEYAKTIIRHIIELASDSYKIDLILAIMCSENDRIKDQLQREIYRSPELTYSAVNSVVNGERLCCISKLDLIRSLGSLRLKKSKVNSEQLNGIRYFAEHKIQRVYAYAASLYILSQECSRLDLYELVMIVLRDELYEAAGCAIDTLAILDESGFIAEGRSELRIEESDERAALVELLESTKDSVLKDFTIPILESFPLSVYAEMANSRLGLAEHANGVLVHSDSVLLTATLALLLEIDNQVRSTFIDISDLLALQSDDFEHVRKLSVLFSDTTEGVMATKNDTIEILNRVLYLKKNELFASVSASKLMRLAEGIQEIVYREGDLISREGDRANHLYMIREGTADLVVGFGSSDPVTFSELRAGGTYGEVGLFNQDIRTASVVATSECQVYVFSRSYLRKMVSQIPELANTFLQVLGKKLQTSHEEVVRLRKENSSRICS